MSDLVPFDYSGREVRTVLVDDEPWFVALDVCAVLGIRNASDAVRGLDEDEVGTTEVIDATGRAQQVRTISEPGLYALLARSRRPEARPFRRWVNHDVLPAIRKTGSYVAPNAAPVARPGSQLDVLAAVVAEMQRVETLVLNAGQDARVANARLDAIEGRHDYFAALGWAKLRKFAPTDERTLAALGRIASTVGKQSGMLPGSAPHARHGSVNTWPLEVWDEAVKRMRGAA